MADDMRLLMHPDIGTAITDAALHDAEHAVTVASSDAGSEPPRAQGPYGGRPFTARNSGGPRPTAGFQAQALRMQDRSKALASTATPSSADSASVIASVTSSGSSVGGGSVPKKRASPKAKAAPKFASVLAEKHDLLFRMNRMCTRGGKQSRTMGVADSLEELRCECDRMQREIETEKSVKFQRSLMTSFATGVECLNARWNFAGIKLDGWSQSLQDDMDNYDEVFEELHAKYATKSVMPPEIKLIMMIASSAFMFHMSKSMFSSVPGMEDAMRDDPELARKVAAAVAKKAHQNESAPERRGVSGMFAGLMGAGAVGAPAGTVSGRPMSPPDEDSLAGVERLFSDDDSGSEEDRASVKSGSASLELDGDNGLILDT